MPFLRDSGLRAPSARRRATGSPGGTVCARSAAGWIARIIASFLPNDEEARGYDQDETLTAPVFPYVEGHKFYCEH